MSQAMENGRVVQGDTKSEFLATVWRTAAEEIEEQNAAETRSASEADMLPEVCRETAEFIEQRLDTRKAAEVLADEFGLDVDEVEAVLESMTAEEEADDGDNGLEELAGDENRDEVESMADVEQRAETTMAEVFGPDTATARAKRRRRQEAEQAGAEAGHMADVEQRLRDEEPIDPFANPGDEPTLSDAFGMD